MREMSLSDTKKIAEIVNKFEIGNGEIDMIHEFGGGRINHTYKITVRGEGGRSEYLLQSINNFVFPDAKLLMKNIINITEHIRKNNGNTITFIALREFMDDGGKSYVYIAENGAAWRMYNFIDADVYESIIHSQHAYMLGRAIADFSDNLSDFDASTLYPTIPDFHNTPKRFEALLLSIVEDVISGDGRSKKQEEVVRQIKFVLERKDKLGILVEGQEEGKLPLRVTHNDPKISNVLVNKATGLPMCMIDLDTCMPGTILYDVGDALRSIANTVSEEEKDESLVDFSEDIFEAFVNGFVSGMDGLLTKYELQLIPYSVWVISMELGMRFLKDHIDGNCYFKTVYDGQNLERSKIQFRLAEVIEKKIESGVLDEIVNSVVRR